MLKNLAFYSIFFVACVAASGRLSILNLPSSLEFKGNEKLPVDAIGDMLSASLGYFINTSAKWSGLYIKDPFNTPQNAIAILIDSSNEIYLKNNKIKSYQLIGNDYGDSLTTLSSMMESNKNTVVELNLNEGIETLKNYPIMGDLKLPSINKMSGSNLKPDLHSEDKLFLQQIAILNLLSDLLTKPKSTINLLVINLSMKPLITIHGENSPIITEAFGLLSESIEKLDVSSKNISNDDTIFVVATIKENTVSKRTKRQTSETDLNLSKPYDENYPVIFNIILWFMVAFVFALIAIAYVIADMDPGRDSIIYRMTSTRMKKEN